MLGAGFGAATSLANGLVSSDSSTSLARIPGLILDAGWAWAAIAVLAGWVAGTPLRAVVSGALALLAATTTYYYADSVIRDEPLASYWPEISRWWLASVVFGPLLGVIGAGARRPGLSGLVCRLVVPAAAILQLVVSTPGPGAVVSTPAATWARTIVAAAATASVAAFVYRFLVTRRRVADSAARRESS